MQSQSQTSYYLVSLFAALRELPGEACERELEARCADPELKQQLRTMLADDRRGRARELKAGTLLDRRYQLELMLGEGASASVWSAYDRKLQRKATLKIFDRGRCAELDLERALHEARHASHVASEHVIRIRDVAWCTSTELPYIEMEPCAAHADGRWQYGQSMAQTRARDQAEVIRWLIEASRGVQAAHECGVFHCDLKPHNILIRPNRSAVVTDFGLSVRAPGTADPELEPRPARWVAGGTPSYMAPERIDGLLLGPTPTVHDPATGPHPLARADIYALGAVLYHMLAGEPPYAIDRAAPDPLLDVLRRIRSGAPPPLGQLAAARGMRLASGLERAVERAMARAPSGRHASAAAFADELGRCLERMHSVQQTRTRLARTSRFALAGMAAVLLSSHHGAVGLDAVDARPNEALRGPVSAAQLGAVTASSAGAEVVAAELTPEPLSTVAPGAQAARRANARPPKRVTARSVVAGKPALRARDAANASSHAKVDDPPGLVSSTQTCAVGAPSSHPTPLVLPSSLPIQLTLAEPPRAAPGDAQQVLAFVRRALREPDQLVKVVHAGQRAPAYCLLESDEDGAYACLQQAFVVGEIASSLRSTYRHSELQREWTADERGLVTRACETTDAAGSYIKRRTCEQPPSTPLTVTLPAERSALAMRAASSTGGSP